MGAKPGREIWSARLTFPQEQRRSKQQEANSSNKQGQAGEKKQGQAGRQEEHDDKEMLIGEPGLLRGGSVFDVVVTNLVCIIKNKTGKRSSWELGATIFRQVRAPSLKWPSSARSAQTAAPTTPD